MANKLTRKSRKKILIVDDDPTMRSLLREILTGRRYDVVEAQDGQEALDKIHKETIDLLITDRAMPGMGGLDLLRALREEKREIPALLISAYGDEELWASAIGLGAEDYLLKPFSTESVMRVVKRKLL
jgi:CheY-like chemotaxis protein